MSSFHPTRTSPPSKRLQLAAYAAQNALEDISRSSTISAPELTKLTPEDVAILDAIIERASPSATTFLSVFKAYNDVLQERGLDRHEVVYYEKLLKLGTLKGKNWGEKWKMVKHQCGYIHGRDKIDGRKERLGPSKRTSPSSSTPISSTHNFHPVPPFRDSDSLTLTLHSHQDDSDFCPSDVIDGTELDATQPYRAQWPLSRRPPSAITATSSSCRDSSLPTRRTHPVSSILKLNATTFPSEVSEIDADGSSTIPPSYRAAIRDPPHRPTSLLFSHHRSKSDHPSPSSQNTPSAAHQVVAQARKRRKSVVNEDEAWNKIQMLRNEKEADKFREDILVERCWDLWRRGFQWIHVSTCLSVTLKSYTDSFIDD
jgi:protein SFI1